MGQKLHVFFVFVEPALSKFSSLLEPLIKHDVNGAGTTFNSLTAVKTFIFRQVKIPS